MGAPRGLRLLAENRPVARRDGRAGAALACRGRVFEGILTLLFPDACGACRAPVVDDGSAAGALLCEVCRAAVDPVPAGVCRRCGTHLEAGRTCLRCALAPPPWGEVQVGALYGGPLMEALRACKYGPRPELVRGLARLFAAGTKVPRGARIVPVPTHPRRIRDRGFDLTFALAAEVAARSQAPLLPGALVRHGRPVHLAGRRRRERQALVQGAFRVGPLRRWVRGRRVLLVDDVLTTGATVGAATRVLLSGGATQVDVAVLARVERDV